MPSSPLKEEVKIDDINNSQSVNELNVKADTNNNPQSVNELNVKADHNNNPQSINELNKKSNINNNPQFFSALNIKDSDKNDDKFVSALNVKENENNESLFFSALNVKAGNNDSENDISNNEKNKNNDVVDKSNPDTNYEEQENKNPEEEIKKEVKEENEKEVEKVNENEIEKENEDEVEKVNENEVEKVNESEVEKVNENEVEKVNENEKDNIPAIVIDNVDDQEDENEKKDKEGEQEEKKEEENIADNLEIKGEFNDIFTKNLEEEDTTELNRTLSNLYDKIKILSKDNINTVGIVDNNYEILKTEGATEDDLNKYYQSFSGTLQRFKPMTRPSTELCNTINNRYHNNINIQEFFEHLEKITTQNAGAINSSLSSLVTLMHGPKESSSHLDLTSGNSARENTLKHPKKGLNPTDAGLNRNYRNFFKYSKKKFNHNNQVFVSNITNDTIPIPNINVPTIPSEEELPNRDPLSLGIYYHNRQQYDIADYYFTLSSIDNNALGLYLHGMYIKYGHGGTGCSPELGFQYLLKSAEASIQSIPTINKNSYRMASTLGTIEEDQKSNKGRGSEDHGKGKDHDDDSPLINKIPLKDDSKEEKNELAAEKMLMKTNIANIVTNLTDEEFETWIVRCIVSLPIYEIGQSLLHGHGVPKSTSKAVYCFNVAAYMGDADAQLALAQCYKLGIGVKKTRKMAAKWYRKAHSNGKCIFGESWVWKSKYD